MASKRLPTSKINKHGYFILALGILTFIASLILRWHQSRILSFSTTPQDSSATTGLNKPISITLPKLNRTLSIEEARISDNTWEVSETGASHWDNSANPGDSGNIVIYGHNKNNLFGPIRWLETGDKIEITDTNGNLHTYQITATKTVPPTDISVVSPTSDETLTLYTCTGFLDQKRFIVIAKPISALQPAN